MNNFVYHIPTRIYFGKGQVENLGPAAKEYGSRVLVVSYIGGSEPEQKIYAEVLDQLQQSGLEVFSFTDVQANPQVDTINDGARLCREKGIDLVLAVGGGSAIDCAKVIAEAAAYDGDAWDLVLDNSKVEKVLPVAAVVTIAASGSEMDTSAVVNNAVTNEKLMIFNDGARPRFSILDPTYTFSVPAFQTAIGSLDIMSHAMEVYFTLATDAYLLDSMAEAVMRTVVRYAQKAVDEPDNYEARANLMWAASLAINGMLSSGKTVDWAVHNIEHEISAYYSKVPHGAGVVAVTPYWMEYTLNEETAPRYARFAQNVFGVAEPNMQKAAAEGIRQYRGLCAGLGLPGRLRDIGVTDEYLAAMARGAVRYGPIKGFCTLEEQDVLNILQNAL